MFDRMTPEILLIGIGLAILLPVVPFTLEMLALRRLTTAAFGTLMALEPAFAMLVGLLILHQVPGPAGVVGICLVVAAGVGAAHRRAFVTRARRGGLTLRRHSLLPCATWHPECRNHRSPAQSTRWPSG